jgi:hypothetical protein
MYRYLGSNRENLRMQPHCFCARSDCTVASQCATLVAARKHSSIPNSDTSPALCSNKVFFKTARLRANRSRHMRCGCRRYAARRSGQHGLAAPSMSCNKATRQPASLSSHCPPASPAPANVSASCLAVTIERLRAVHLLENSIAARQAPTSHLTTPLTPCAPLQSWSSPFDC